MSHNRLDNGQFRVHVYAGTDPDAGKLLAQVDGDNRPNREATRRGLAGLPLHGSRQYRRLVRIEHHLDGEYACDARA